MKSMRKNSSDSFDEFNTPVEKTLISSGYATVQYVAKLIQVQEVSPVEVVEACLQRIEDLNPKLNAFITVLADQARAQAKEAEAEIKAGKWRGPLHGIPVGIKDFYDTAGIRTTAGFEHFKDRIPAKDAENIIKLKKAGAILIGKTNMHTLGVGTTGLDSYFGPVRNPWNADYIPGGSSSGSAAAVASGMCYATLDTDAVGSCRLPAACCGVVGFKGTYGLISAQGILEGEKADEMILWMSHPALTTRSVQDTAIVLDVLAEPQQPNNHDRFVKTLAGSRTLRIGVVNNFKATQEIKTAFEQVIEVIHSLGYPMSSIAALIRDLSRGFANIEADRNVIADLAFKEIDILLLPTTTTTVPTITAAANPQALSPENTAFANYYGLPAISLLCGFDSKGLPIGLQMVGRPWEESAILQLAYEYQAATQYHEKHPFR